jgi:hypothetical protein
LCRAPVAAHERRLCAANSSGSRCTVAASFLTIPATAAEVEGGKVARAYSPIGPVEPTGQYLEWELIGTFRYDDGRLAEEWVQPTTAAS